MGIFAPEKCVDRVQAKEKITETEKKLFCKVSSYFVIQFLIGKEQKVVN
jgi:hypothetical protein